ncbi:uncharacterized protein LOC122251260 isoform X3 [Penaeus japonicus]|uniref:uncharacterized protein LOC122251260 isoform X3 n=1 Tax=Penaeus japonicus TaxID=27405 RepID=UPI001C7141F7|nr:uncharacterized protein LOC122251260 isoform X3 [Penaeus japonicus]
MRRPVLVLLAAYCLVVTPCFSHLGPPVKASHDDVADGDWHRNRSHGEEGHGQQSSISSPSQWDRSDSASLGYKHKNPGSAPGYGSRAPISVPWRGHRTHTAPSAQDQLNPGSFPGHGYPSHSSPPGHGQRDHISPPWHTHRGHSLPYEHERGLTHQRNTGPKSHSFLLGKQGLVSYRPEALTQHTPLIPDQTDYHGSHFIRNDDNKLFSHHNHDASTHHSHEPISHHKYDSSNHYEHDPVSHHSHHSHHNDHHWSPFSQHNQPFSPYYFWRSHFQIYGFLNHHTHDPFHHYHGHHHHHDPSHDVHHHHHDPSHHGHHHHHGPSHQGHHHHDASESNAKPAPSECPRPYERAGRLCVHAPLSGQVWWDKARQYCRNMSGDLVTFSSANDFAEIITYLQGKSKNPYLREYWIGGRRVDNQWKWVNNETMPKGSPYWAIFSLYGNYKYYQAGMNSLNDCAYMSRKYFFYLKEGECYEEKYPLCLHEAAQEGARDQHGGGDGREVTHHGSHHGGYAGHHAGHHVGHAGHHGYFGYHGVHDWHPYGHHGGHDWHHEGHSGHDHSDESSEESVEDTDEAPTAPVPPPDPVLTPTPDLPEEGSGEGSGMSEDIYIDGEF